MNAPLRIPVLVGSVRRGRQSLKVARFASDRLERAGAYSPLLDLRDFNLPIAGMAVSRVSGSFSDDGEPMEEHYEKAFAGFVETLTWYTRAIGAATDS